MKYSYLFDRDTEMAVSLSSMRMQYNLIAEQHWVNLHIRVK